MATAKQQAAWQRSRDAAQAKKMAAQTHESVMGKEAMASEFEVKEPAIREEPKEPELPAYTKPRYTSHATNTPKQPKLFRFELYPSDDNLIPTDEFGQKRAPYPPMKNVANTGMAINPKTGMNEEWRYVYTFQKSIWVSEQPANIPKSQLTDSRNELWFRRGMMHVREFETAKLAALMIQDEFKGCVNPLRPELPKAYFLVDEDEANLEILGTLNDNFLAEQRAREMSAEDMYAIASLFAIDLNQSDSSIRTKLILKSRSVPKVFLREAKNPATKIRFMFLTALQEGTLSASQRTGFVVWGDTGVVICEVKEGVNTADELTRMWNDGNEKVVKLANTLKGMFQLVM